MVQQEVSSPYPILSYSILSCLLFLYCIITLVPPFNTPYHMPSNTPYHTPYYHITHPLSCRRVWITAFSWPTLKHNLSNSSYHASPCPSNPLSNPPLSLLGVRGLVHPDSDDAYVLASMGVGLPPAAMASPSTPTLTPVLSPAVEETLPWKTSECSVVVMIDGLLVIMMGYWCG